MRKSWLSLSKGDKLYVLYPKIDLDGKYKYEYQESEVISIKTVEYDEGVYPIIKFKITNSYNRRQRFQIFIPYDYINSRYIWINPENKYVNKGTMYGNIIMCFENPKENLQGAYQLMINLKKKEIDTLIICYQEFSNELEEMKSKKVI